MKQYSGKFILRLSPSFHRSLAMRASTAGVSLNQYCTRLLQLSGQAQPAIGPRGSAPVLPEWLNHIVSNYQEKLIALYLFGSVARQEQTEVSDVDLLVVFSPEVEIDRSYYTDWDRSIAPFLSRYFAREVTPHFVTLPSSVDRAGSIWYEVALHGIALWEKNRSVAGFLIDIRSAIAHGRIKRYISHGHPYWIREDSHA